jgi:hypothetical protein
MQRRSFVFVRFGTNGLRWPIFKLKKGSITLSLGLNYCSLDSSQSPSCDTVPLTLFLIKNTANVTVNCILLVGTFCGSHPFIIQSGKTQEKYCTLNLQTRVSNFFSSSYSMQRQKLFHLFHIESKLFQNYSTSVTTLLLQPKKAHKQFFTLLVIIFQKNSLNL